ncbi:hypothetical protein ACQKM9_17395 [Viridibacillus sp. NPDC093762]|uniref:hypothetical protein n=1 Tax=Viridibacillus sp. NPDC093762 TaxID=3390720 RepID=UPI003CFF392A
MKKVSVLVNFPPSLLKKIDTYKEEQTSFSTRTQAILYLLDQALEITNNKNENKGDI